MTPFVREWRDHGYAWKHLPYAIYIDTNALRSAGLTLDKQWINELISKIEDHRQASVDDLCSIHDAARLLASSSDKVLPLAFTT